MKIYKAWSDSNHKTTYIAGYFLKKEDAEKALEIFGPDTASNPQKGVEEIEVLDSVSCPHCKKHYEIRKKS